eukprot:TRINITY_DN5214_c0_g1_i1.p1 TRINITY_DN5214_c0_g1~~TRINITY_DN5214_c0_g1_i1.p1  ORF type:complete len:233 (+),score=63.73 TRINITY_DN5214_c0_g1_i1:36-701(+)
MNEIKNEAWGEMKNAFISIAGIIGAGKTTLANALGECLNIPVYHEPVIDNEYLSDFYQDMGKYGFPMQIYLLNRRFQQHQEIIWKGHGGVQDRTIYEDAVFCRMLMKQGHIDERDYKTYTSLFKHMSNFMCKPNVIVFLDVTPEESMDRVKQRSRDCETGVSIDYLQALYDEYKLFIKEISTSIPVISVRWNKFREVNEVAAAIKTEYERIGNIREARFLN